MGVVLAGPAAAGECTDLGSGVRVGTCGEAGSPEPAPGGSTTTTAPPAPPAGRDTEAATRLFRLVNDERRAAGLAELAARAEIEEVAWGHSDAMADAGEIWHNDAYFTAESRRRLGASALGENVARNTSVEDAHARLMASPGHRANVLDARFTEIGVAVVRDGQGSLFVTEDFAAVRAAAPAAPHAAALPATSPATVSAPTGADTDTSPPAELSAGGQEGAPAAPIDGPAGAPADQVRPAAVSRALVTAAAAPGPPAEHATLAAGVCALCALGLLDRRRGGRAHAGRTGLSISISTLPSRSRLT